MSNKKEIDFQYGKDNISIKIPEKSIIAIPHIKHVGKINNEMVFLTRSLCKPISCPPLFEIARRKKNAVVVVSDRTRPMPTDRVLPLILKELNRGGIEDKKIKVIIALGTHRAMNDEEIIKLVGGNVKNRVEVKNHDWNKKEKLVSLGRTANGTYIDVNKEVYNADLVVGISSVKPHRAAGWSGGSKIIDPGVCGERTVCKTHYLTVNYKIEEVLGLLDNPFRKESEKVARKVGLNFSINLVLNEDDDIVNIFSGDFIEAHKMAAKFAETIYRDPQKEKADFMICGAGEWGPDFWGAVQAIFSAEYLVKNGGTIVFFARCPEGLAPEHPQLSEIGYRPISEIFKMVKEKKITDLAAVGHSVAVSRIIVEKDIECIIISEGISKEIANCLGLKWMKYPQEAVDYIFKKHSSSARGYLFPGKSVTDTVVIPW
jgi:nickel-dependent lactate racemase